MTLCPPAASSARVPLASCGAAVRDALWRGRLPLWQPARRQGYRFNLDSVLLADFVDKGPHAHVIDLGAGCGIIGLLLLAGNKARQLTAVERQTQLAALARQNLQALHVRLAQVLEVDLREQTLPQACRVVFNPPYFPLASGRASVEPGRDAGRRECHGTLADFVAAAARALTDDGELCAIVPYGRGAELTALCTAVGLHVRRRRRVQKDAAAPPRHLLLAAGRLRPLVAETLPPLLVHDVAGRGGYSAEVAALIDGPDGWSGPPADGADRSPSTG